MDAAHGAAAAAAVAAAAAAGQSCDGIGSGDMYGCMYRQGHTNLKWSASSSRAAEAAAALVAAAAITWHCVGEC
jgi:hypothetical protein